MGKQSLLLVDGDTRSLRLLEVSLKKAGYAVTTAINGADGLAKMETITPDLIISDTKMAEMDGFEFCKRIKQNSAWSGIPFIFLTDQKDLEDKVHGLELGVDDYLTKPIYLKEIVSRVQILLEKHQQRGDPKRGGGAKTKFHGQLQDMAVVDLIQTIEIGRKSGVIHFATRDGKFGSIYFRNGKVIDAEQGRLSGEEAVYRLLNWTDGEFDVEFKNIRRRDVIEMSSQGLLMEGMRRVDEWSRLCEQLPPLDTVLEVDSAELSRRLSQIPDEVNGILRLFDGHRSITDVVDDCEFGDLEALNIILKLLQEAILVPQGRADAFDGGIAGGMVALRTQTAPLPDDGEAVLPENGDRTLAPGNVIRFPTPGGGAGAPPGGAGRLPPAWSSARASFSEGGAPASSVKIPNDLLEPVAGETEHMPRPQPVLLPQPPVIVQGVSVQDGLGRDPNAPLAGDDSQGERTERIEFPPPKEPTRSVMPYVVAGSLVISGVVLGFLALEGDRVVLPFWHQPGVQRPREGLSERVTEAGKAVSGGSEQPGDEGEPSPPAGEPQQARSKGGPKPPPLLSMTSETAKVETLLIQARGAYKRSAFRKASLLLEEVLSRKPGHAEAIALQALVSLGEGKTAKGAELARKALAIDESVADAHLVLGTIDLESDRVPKAREHFGRYLQLMPKGDHADDVRAVLKRLQ